jgi:hypothetical protein
MPVKVAFESLPVEGEGEVWAGGHQTVGRREKCGGERHGIAHRAADLGVKLSDQGDVNQRRP